MLPVSVGLRQPPVALAFGFVRSAAGLRRPKKVIVQGTDVFVARNRTTTSASGGATPQPASVRKATEEAVGRLLAPKRVHDVFNPRFGVTEDSPPSWVSDVPKLLSDTDSTEIDAICAALVEAWRFEVAVVLLESLPEEIQPSAFAAALLNFWGVGDKRLHTGLLVLLLSKQRRLEMRVGFGAGRALPPECLRSIQDECMVPHLRNGAVGAALRDGLRAVSIALEAGAPSHWRRDKSAQHEPNRHGFGGGQTSIDEFMPTSREQAGASPNDA